MLKHSTKHIPNMTVTISRRTEVFTRQPPREEKSFEEFEAATLFCPRCRQAVPVRKRLLLVLPEGDKYDYMCSYCGTSVGSKLDVRKDNFQIII